MAEKRTKPLTPSEQRALEAVRSEWLAVGLSTEPADRPEAEAAVKDLYAVMGWKEPMTIWMESPLGGCYAAAWFEELWKGKSKKDQLWDQLWSQLWDQLWSQLRDELGGQLRDELGGQLRDELGGQLRDELWDQLWSQLRDELGGQLRDELGGQLRDELGGQLRDELGGQLRDELWSQLRDELGGQLGGQLGSQPWDQLWSQLWGQLRDELWGQLGGQLWDQLWSQLRDELGDELGDQLRKQISNAWWGQHDASWIAWLRFARELGPTYDKHLDQGLEAWSRITRSCGWWWPREGVVILTERPSVLHRDPANRLHCEDGPAIRYLDGWGVWAWHGLRVEQEIIENSEALTAAKITKEKNATLRRTYMEVYGQGRYMAEAAGELLDEVTNPPFLGLAEAKLWRLPNPDGSEPLTCVECKNSTPEPDGSYRRYSLWVHPELRPLLDGDELGEPQELTAHNALASTFGERGETYAPVLET